MHSFHTHRFFRYRSLTAWFLASVGVLSASIEGFSPALGGIKVTAGGARETSLGIPFHRSPVILTEVGSMETNFDSGGNFLHVRISFIDPIGDPGAFSPGAEDAQPRFFLEFTSGEAAGERFPIIGNGERSVLIGAIPEGTVAAYFVEDPESPPTAPRDLVAIRPFWTIGNFDGGVGAELDVYDSSSPELARNGDAVVLAATANERTLQRLTNSTTGQTHWGERTTAGAYQQTSDSDVWAADRVGIAPGQGFRVRRADQSPVSFYFTGDAVALDRLTPPTPDGDGIVQWPFTLARSNPVNLEASGLSEGLRASASAADRRDELIVWEDLAGFHPRPAHRFFLLEDAQGAVSWREVGDPLVDRGDFVLRPGSGYLIRRR